MKTTRVAILTLGLCQTGSALGQIFQAMPLLSGENTNAALALSGDGSVAVGNSATQAIRWRIGSAVQPLGVMSGFNTSAANSVSFNGSVITGQSATIEESVVFRWTQNEGMALIPTMSVSTNISADGSTVVGYGPEPSGGTSYARRWRQDTGTQRLGAVSGTPFGLIGPSFPYATTADGGVTYGVVDVVTRLPSFPLPAETIFTPLRWNANGTASTIPALNGSLLRGSVGDCTPTGDVLVGTLFETPVDTYFRWTASGGYQDIAPMFQPSAAFRPQITADGNTFVAGLNFWTFGGGVRDLRVVLQQAGCDFTGWTLNGAIGISDDGRTIAGNGVNPLGQQQGWVATIPSPGAAGVLALLAGIVGVQQRTRTGHDTRSRAGL